MRSILVCETQVPFVDGGAERLVRGLVGELRRHGYRAETVSIPFKSYPKGELLAQAAMWRLVDLSESNYESVDAVITTKFPNYFVRHPNKVTWLLHQYRAIYDLCGTPFSEFTDVEADVRLRDRLIALDTEVLAESKRLFSISRTTTARLARYNGLTAEPLYHPPLLAGTLAAGPFGDYVLSVGRLEQNKRVELVVRALALTDRSVRLVIAGHGGERSRLEALASKLAVADRIVFAGIIDDRQLVDLYAGALAVVFPPLDEDYGYVTLEAMLSAKPVVTCTDSGGPLEFVLDGETGCVTAPDPLEVARALERLAAQPGEAARMGRAGRDRALAMLPSWDVVVETLLAKKAST